MNKNIPLWVFLMSLLIGALFTMVFGWSVLSTLGGSDKTGRFGKAAVAVSSFPTLAKSVLADIKVNTVDTDQPVRVPSTGAELSEFVEISTNSGTEVNGLLMRVDRALLARAPGWRILIGAFTIDGELKDAALALSPDLEVVHIWFLSEGVIDGTETVSAHRKFVHGFELMADGSVVFAFDGGASLQRFDMCSLPIWVQGGAYSHSVTLDDQEEFVWTLRSPNTIVKVATATGEVVHEFSMTDVIAANPSIGVLDIRKHSANDLGGNSRQIAEMWLEDPFHLNDVDPLPASLAGAFVGFDTGDLLLSSRSLSLVFIVDPDTLAIKWWRAGATQRQHDPDWGPSGKITVYDNRMDKNFSQIMSIDPDTFRTNIVLDGSTDDFYSRIRGKHQISEYGNLIVTSTQQGRVFEVDPDGNMVIDIVNTKPGSKDFNYAISQAIWLPLDAFHIEEAMSCGG